MTREIRRLGVLTSGGDAPGMNAAIRAVVRACVHHGIKPYGIREGYKGLIDGQIEPMNARSVANIVNQGGTLLKSARSQAFRTPEGRQTAFENFRSADLDALVVIGGDGSFTGATLFEKEFGIPVVGVPGTIDNDIFGTDYTIGYDTALNTVVEAVDKIRDTATSHNRLFFVEVMGRDAGFIALNSGIGCGAEEILIPEANRGIDHLIKSLERSDRTGKTSSIVLVAEGGKDGGAFEIAKTLEAKLPDYEARVTVLGHIQRGGRPSCFDRVLASRLGVAAVKTLLEGNSSVMVGVRNNAVALTPFAEAISKHNAIDKELLEVADIVSI
ncbi:MAG: 6-phosphofructokinase [Oceanospirillales bacterium LUC14_002_19_P2]|nr:MAG: 6-phosphofructokinase [Oceanospirillales bacterium LUC14_002_19_P2]